MPLWIMILLIAAILLFFSRPVTRPKYIEQESKDALLSPEELEKHAEEIAKVHTFDKNAGKSDCLLSRMERNFATITSVYRMLNQDIRERLPVPPAAEWLLDNFYIVEEQVKDIRHNLAKEKCLKLNILSTGFLKGYPRIYALALELVSHLDGRIDNKLLINFIKAYQSQSVLSMAELWALPMMLKLALIENIKNICQKVGRSQFQWRQAEQMPAGSLPDINIYIKENDTLDPAVFSFTEHLLKKMRRDGIDTAVVYQYLTSKFSDYELTLDKIVQEEHREQAARQVAMGNSITSMRTLMTINWNDVFEELSTVERILRQDPAGIYSRMDLTSRHYYRHQVEEIAIQLRTSETNVVRKALELSSLSSEKPEKDDKARHIGYFIVGKGKDSLLKKIKAGNRDKKQVSRLAKYFLSIGALTCGIVILCLVYSYYSSPDTRTLFLLLVGLVALIPASEIAMNLIQRIITYRVQPGFLPKLAYLEGIPEDCTALVVIPTLFPHVNRVKELITQLEVHYLSNKEQNLYFALLGDFKDASEENLDQDGQIAEAAAQGINELNQKYAGEGPKFYFFLRKRTYSKRENRWMGWERKRGAIMELNRLLLNHHLGSFIDVGDISALKKVKYVISLDADTRLPLHTARKLIGTISHPLNRAVYDESKGIVVDGYGLIQPRIGVSVESANKTLFSRIFAGQGGIDPYTSSVSDVYQDYFGEGIFTGKGIYDLEVFSQALSDAIPENTVLSHDLLEGCFVRVGLATDLELVDSYPVRYNSFMMRLHRWVRGDWQLIRWLVTKNPLSPLSKWKIADNLRRSLIPVTVMVLFTLGLTVFPGRAYFWLGFSLLTLGFPQFMGFIDFIVYQHYKTEWKKYHGNMVFGIKAVFYQWAFIWIFLPYQAYMMADAIVRTLHRVCFSRKNMLQWVTAADVERNLKNNVTSFFSGMLPAVIQAILVFLLVLWLRPENFFYAFFICLVWIGSPLVAYYISKPEEKVPPGLTQEAKEELKKLARKIWAFYEDFAGVKDHFLPPDNYQENPPNGIAHRTSPTNIGFLLLSFLAARDFGFITTTGMIERIENTLGTIEKMKKWKGHLYNWYDTRTLKLLKPAYISSVDSGNFVSFLMTLKQGLAEYLARPLIEHSLADGIKTTLALCRLKDSGHEEIEQLLAQPAIPLNRWQEVLDSVPLGSGETPWKEKLISMVHAFQKETVELFPSGMILTGFFARREGEGCGCWAEVIKMLKELDQKPSLKGLENVYGNLIGQLDQLLTNGDLQQDRDDVIELKNELTRVRNNVSGVMWHFHDIITRIEDLVSATNFAPLFDRQKQLFSIGYNIEEEKLTNSYYDLLASEARVTSFLAVARGEVPEEHWFRLGKSLTTVDGYKGLVSWAGTMFEYLMPLLIMKDYPNTLLDETYRFVIKTQQKYGSQRKVPWGTSESGFYAFDIHLNYQYKAFGVPDLGLKRGLINDMVVSPYSSFLALPFDPEKSWENIKRLQAEGIEGDYGLYEAVDYTPERLFLGKKKGIVQSYMAHHQGMSFIALNNFFYDNMMQRRFHHDPVVKSGELLLQEKVPFRVIITKENKEIVEPFEIEEKEQVSVTRRYDSPNLSAISCHLLSNGRYSVLLTKDGLGYSHQEGIQVTRWRDPGFIGKSGFFIFVRNDNEHETWSVTREPLTKIPDQYQVMFASHKGEFIRNDGSITTHTEMTVSPEDDVEIREVTLANHGEEAVVLDVTSYLEVILTSQSTDLAHPVFSNLFVRTEFLPKYEGILAFRRPRETDQPVTWAIHTMLVQGETIGDYQYETDRSKFIGRGRTIAHPAALDPGHPLSNTVGPVLDPVMSLRRRVKVNPGQTVKIVFMLGIAEDRSQAMELAEKYHQISSVKRAFDLAWTRSQVEEGYLNLKPEETEVFQDMVSHIVFLSPLRQKYQDIFRKNCKGQPGLWAYGVSGDSPIVLLTVKNTDEIGTVRSVLKAHEYWRIKGLSVDLVILNEDENSYLQPIQDQIMETMQSTFAREVVNRPGGVFVLNAKVMPQEDINLLFTVSRLILKGGEGPLALQLKERLREENSLPPKKKFLGQKREFVSTEPPLNLAFFNSFGGFDLEKKEYVIRLKEDIYTPAPWINVISRPGFGFLVTETGSGFTWAENSRENRLTPWSNDPVSDSPGEIYYLRDEDSGEIWSITPLPIREKENYTICHGLGYSRFYHDSHGIGQELTLFVSPDDPVKVGLIKLENREQRARKLTITYYLKPVLGMTEQITQQFISLEYWQEREIILMKNSYQHDFPRRIAYMGTSDPVTGFTGNEEEFIGREGSLNCPQALLREGLSGNLETGRYSCAALQVSVELPPESSREIIFFLGQGKNLEDVDRAAGIYKNSFWVKNALEKVKEFWQRKLNTIQVKTPDQSMNIMINQWLLYQVLSCRVWGRSAFYQSGGACGFRDQLQDVLSLVYTEPNITRDQILLHAAHQFREGDVQHWWHPGIGDKGVRTRFSDDSVWLVFAVSEYIRKTGDFDLLNAQVPYLEEDPLKDGEQERYGIPQVSQEVSSIYEHCMRSLDRAIKLGSHGIPLMGSGDWNDGMNCVGSRGEGESIWLGWFLYRTLQLFLPLCRMMKDDKKGKKYQEIAENIRQNIEEQAWDGNWYLRAYFDDGKTLGSSENSECKIDSLAQSWAVISGAGQEERVQEAMTAVENYLVKNEEGLILLLTPPFDDGDLNPGYIKGYVPGVRENGGQYTHAAAWVVAAFAQLGMGDKAWALYQMINPINHSRTSIEAATYKVEPYVMAADVYAVSPHIGRGGWTWYTGAASWMYKVGLEEILGFQKNGTRLKIDPCIPKEWPGYQIDYRYMDTLYQIRIKNPLGVNKGVKQVMVDEKEIKDFTVILENDRKEHSVLVVLG